MVSPSLRRRRATLTAVLLAVLLAIGAPSLPAGAQTAPSNGRTPSIVPAALRIRAFGDGVTAGFGIDSSGAVLPISDAGGCRPRWIVDGSETTSGTRCSSNGNNGPGSPADEVSFNADFGLRNGASWAAGVAQQLGAVDFANYAVAGSTLVSWMNFPRDELAPAEGAHHDLLERIERDDPDIVLATIGGESMLQQQAGPIRACASWGGVENDAAGFQACVKSVLDDQLVKQRVMAIAFDVLANTQNSRLLFATYIPADPGFTALLPAQQVVLADAINAQLRAAVEGVAESGAAWSERIELVSTQVLRDACSPSVVSAPRFLARNWFVDRRCGGPSAGTDAGEFTPVSFGTVPGRFLQGVMATTAVAAIRARNWVSATN